MFEAIEATSPELIDALMAENLPTSDLAEPNRHFWRATINGKAAGYVGLEIYDAMALLRSLVVLPLNKSHGLGTRLVDHALREAHSQGAREVWLLTKTARPFFDRLGWQLRERGEAPESIASSREFAGLCPASATCMSRTTTT
jgi:amino-acid N-acetyltransferase